jgi:hypothetical protein
MDTNQGRFGNCHMTDNLPQTQSEILIYQTEEGRTRIDVRLEDETVWLSQKLLTELFQKDVCTINEHVKNIYAEGELEPQATIRKFRMVQTEGKRQVARQVDFYNLDVINSVVQNKMHWVAHGHTNAEIVAQRADAAKPNMDLTSWAGDKPRRADAEIAKNYLTAEELDALNRKPMYMKDWIAKLDEFLRISDREILLHAGRISHDDAIETARVE